jgi:AraC-like DNA-binding protein
MKIDFTFSLFLLLAGVLQGIFTVFLLFFKKENKQANVILAFLVLSMVGTMSHNFLSFSGIFDQKPSLYFLPIVLNLAAGPLLYFYVNEMTVRRNVPKTELAWHFLPVFWQFAFNFWAFLQSVEQKQVVYETMYAPFVEPAQTTFLIVSFLIYLLFSFRIFYNYKNKIAEFYSNTDKISLHWLYLFLIILSIYWLVVAGSYFAFVFFKMEFCASFSDYLKCAAIYATAIFALRARNLVEIGQNLQKIDPPPTAENVEKTREINPELLQKIRQTVENEQLFLKPELTINDLAERLKLPPKIISNQINSGLGKSFLQYINEQRVENFKEKINSNQFEHLSMLGVALESGFNSKSSFNRIFKEITGISPSEFKNSSQNAI